MTNLTEELDNLTNKLNINRINATGTFENPDILQNVSIFAAISAYEKGFQKLDADSIGAIFEWILTNNTKLGVSDRVFIMKSAINIFTNHFDDLVRFSKVLN